MTQLNRNRALVMVPSDTCYGIAARPSGRALSQTINDVLGRDEEPISLAFDDLAMVKEWVIVSTIAGRLIEKFMPGPITVVCPIAPEVPPEITNDVLAAPNGTIGVRIPDSHIERDLCGYAASPLTTVAVRDSATQPVRDYEHAKEIVNRGISMLPSNRRPIWAAVEGDAKMFADTHSTVVAFDSGGAHRIVRAGAISADEIASAAGESSRAEIQDFT